MSIFICSVCGHIEFTEIPVTCPVCETPAEKFKRNDTVFEDSAEKSKEAAIKHIPAITINKKCGLIPEQSCTDIIVRIGATLHPMESAHFIRFIDCYVDNKYLSRINLTPGVYAAGSFHLKVTGAKILIVENCTIHGYWKNEISL
jgi:desulfoferrodoxin (superoxide reductase-like protein)